MITRTASTCTPPSTERLRFRTWREDDLPLALALWGDARVTAFLGGPFTEEKVRQRLDAEMSSQRENGMQYWPIFLGADGDHVGCCGVRPYASRPGFLEIGFHLRPEHWGKGLAIEAARAAMIHAFVALNAPGLFAGHHPDNSGSRRIIERLGLRYSYDEFYPPTGKDHPGYLLTREEFRLISEAR